MRIIGGEFSGRKLKEFDLTNIRPTGDKVRESLFNILRDKVQDCSFLDLFCGSGAIGIEALSRGAKSVTFNDLSKDSINLTKYNLDTLKVKGKLFNLEAKKFLQTTLDKFDIIFIDPPYKENYYKDIIPLAKNCLNKNGIIIVESEESLDYFDTLWKYDERKYGRAYLTFYREKQESCLVAGTFDPVTNGHLEIIKEIANRYNKVTVGVGVNENKVPYFSLKDRLYMLNLVCKNFNNVKVDSYDILTAEYMKKNDIKVSVRGIRNEIDLQYENAMKKLNEEIDSNFKTEYIFVKGKNAKISSSLVREMIEKNENYSSLLPKEILDYIKVIVNK